MEKLKRIFDAEGYFLRDDYYANETEIAIDIPAIQGFLRPKWDDKSMSVIEGADRKSLAAYEKSKALKARTWKIARIKAEGKRRVYAEWDRDGQVNALLGIYGEEAKIACAAHIQRIRSKVNELLAKEDLFGLDEKDDALWE